MGFPSAAKEQNLFVLQSLQKLPSVSVTTLLLQGKVRAPASHTIRNYYILLFWHYTYLLTVQLILF